MTETLVPLISSRTTGLGGLVHLPRLWLKVSLFAVDALREGYRHGEGGFDERLLRGIGLDREAFVRYIEAEFPDEPACERWVFANAARVDATAVAAVNAEILGRQRPEPAAGAVRAFVGLDEPAFTHSAQLNEMEDWQTVYLELLARDAPAPMIPTISSGVAGPLGAIHLPRLWMKALLKGLGALPAGYNSGFGLDGVATENLGIDMAASVAFIETERPSYLVYEEWVREHAARCDPAGIEAHNAAVRALRKPPERAGPEREEVGLGDLDLTANIVLNDLLDWKALHQEIRSRDAARA